MEIFFSDTGGDGMEVLRESVGTEVKLNRLGLQRNLSGKMGLVKA